MRLHDCARLRAWTAAVVLAAQASAVAAAELAGVPVAGWAWARIGADGRLEAQAAGGAELAPDGAVLRPLSPATPVRVASVSKVVVALAILRLADRGRIDLDEDASRYLGQILRNPRHPHVPVTVRQLLRHESSLSDAGGYAAELGDRLADSLGPAAWSEAAPGTRFDYANLNSVVLATIVEMQTGHRWDRAAQELVLRPLGIAACFNWSGCPEGFAGTGAVLYRKSPDSGETWDRSGPWVPQVDAERPPGGCPVRLRSGALCNLEPYLPGTHGGLFSPQGGLRISAAELARLGRSILANAGGFLKPATHAALFRPVRVKPGGEGEETDTRLMRFWSEGGLHCLSGTGEPLTDQPLAPRRTTGCGHLGEAYGLVSGLLMDPESGTATAWLLTGTADRPPPGRSSRFTALEEALIRRAAGP
ncbi:serine hydrolase domain-containing protein [Thermaurantiacus sp.]